MGLAAVAPHILRPRVSAARRPHNLPNPRLQQVGHQILDDLRFQLRGRTLELIAPKAEEGSFLLSQKYVNCFLEPLGIIPESLGAEIVAVSAAVPFQVSCHGLIDVKGFVLGRKMVHHREVPNLEIFRGAAWTAAPEGTEFTVLAGSRYGFRGYGYVLLLKTPNPFEAEE